MPDWTPEVVVTADLARRLIDDQFPSLRAKPIRMAGQGWDNVVYEVDGTWYFRFPQRAAPVPGVRLEIECLPFLSSRLPSPVPRPDYVGAPSGSYPWPFFGYAKLKGTEPEKAELTLEERSRLAAPLGRFLRALHDPAIYEKLKDKVPVDPIGRLDFAKRSLQSRERFERLAALGIDLEIGSLGAIFERALRAPRPVPDRVVHGDLHFRHWLIAEDRGLAGVIDWGDLHLNDPGIDLQLYWSFLPDDAARKAFILEYGPIRDESLLYARGAAVYINAALLEYAVKEKLGAVEREARSALALSLLD